MWGITAVHVGDNSSTCGRITAVHVGIPLVLWRLFSTVEGNINTAEVAKYNGDKDLRYQEFSKNFEILTRAYFALKSDQPHHRPQLLTIADIVKDLGYKKLGLGKIRLSQGVDLAFLQTGISRVGYFWTTQKILCHWKKTLKNILLEHNS